MKHWVVSIAFLVGCFCVSLAAAEGSFAFPAAVIKISNPSWKRESSTEVGRAADARGALIKEMSGPGGSVARRIDLLNWQFVGKSDFGDVYVFSFSLPNGEKEIVPAVFDGVTPLVIDRRQLRVEISMPKA